MHQSSFLKMQAFADIIRRQRANDTLIIVDYGSQDINGSYKALFNEPNWNYIGIDMAMGKNVDMVLKDPYDWKELADNSVDLFISGQAFEHTEFLWLSVMEIQRVLKPAGLACLITPSAGPEHRYPMDCWRIYPDGMRALSRFAGLAALDTFTEWKPDAYADDSGIWKDTLLIAQKKTESSPAEEASIAQVRNAIKERVRLLAK
jgi:SAM-dependent methyltransferase